MSGALLSCLPVFLCAGGTQIYRPASKSLDRRAATGLVPGCQVPDIHPLGRLLGDRIGPRESKPGPRG